MLLIVVATALTVYGIETNKSLKHASIASVLQQHLPFTVLKRRLINGDISDLQELQQHLPFTVLKR